jgi:hypothetical protein
MLAVVLEMFHKLFRGAELPLALLASELSL